MANILKKKLFHIIMSSDDWQGKLFNTLIMCLIVINVLAVMFETVDVLSSKYATFFYYVELVSIIIFTTEYLLRLWVCTEDEDYKSLISGRIRFIFTPLALIDLFAILPFYLPMLIPIDLRFIRILRLTRLVRLAKLGRYIESLSLIRQVFLEKKEELIITVLFGLMLLTLSSSIMFYCENETQPETFSSIPATLWWGVATLTSVGYGDICPVTALGKIFGALTAFIGIGMFALPTGILGSGFIEVIEKRKQDKLVCPHCGKEL